MRWLWAVLAVLAILLPTSASAIELRQVNNTITISSGTNETVDGLAIYAPDFLALASYNSSMGNTSNQFINITSAYRGNISSPLVVVWNGSYSKTIVFNFSVADSVNLSLLTNLLYENGTLLLPLENNLTFFVFINITNFGILPVDLEIHFNSSYLKIDEAQRLYSGETLFKKFTAYVPFNKTPETTIVNLSVSVPNRGFFQNVSVNVSVVDKTYPTIDINATDGEWGSFSPIHINFSDNIGIKFTKIKMKQPDNFIRSWENTSIIDIGWDDRLVLGRYEITAEAFDQSNNYNSVSKVFFINKVKPFVFYMLNKQDFGKIKIRNITRFEIFSSSKNIPMNISLESLEGDARVFIDTGGDKMELTVSNENYTGKVANIYYADNVFLDFMTNSTGYVTGKIKMNYPNYVDVNNFNEIEFFANFIAYEPPRPYTDTILGKYLMNCTPIENENYYDSYYNCDIRYPIDTEFGSLIFPVAKATYDQNNQNYQQKIDERDAQIGSMFTAMLLLVLLAFVLIVAIFYEYKLYPVLRFKLK